MPVAYDIDCVTCGGPHRVSRKDGKYCPSCFLLKQLEWLRGQYKRPRTCQTCSTRFRPIKQKDLAYCGPCETRQRRDTVPGTACSWKGCGKELHKGATIGVCRSCLKGNGKPDPKADEKKAYPPQDDIVTALRVGQNARMREHSAKIKDAPNLRKVPDAPS